MKSIDKDLIIAGIERANPWWKGLSIGRFSQLPRRIHFDRIYQMTIQRDPLRALVLMGPRRVGKTVLLYQVIDQLINEGHPSQKIMYLSLDNPIFRFSNLENLLIWGMSWSGAELEGGVVFFDEIQYLDTWEQQLKVLVDSYPKTKFVVTGSAAAALHKKSKESGAGRFTNYLLPALSFYEYIFIKGEIENTAFKSIDLVKMNSLYLDYLNFGGFPEAISSEAIRNQPELYIGQDILDKVLGRDLPSIFGISNPNELQKLFASLAYNTSQEISVDNISKQSGVTKGDINKYIGFFEAAYLIRIIEKTDITLKKFQRRVQFKVVLTNPSLRSALFGKASHDSKELEALAETAIFSQMTNYDGPHFPYKYARWNRGNSKGEIDLVHVNLQNEILGALEIKWSDRFATREEKPKSLISFCSEHSLQNALMTSKKVFSESNHDDLKITHVPTSFLCFVIGLTSGFFGMIKHSADRSDDWSELDQNTVDHLMSHFTATRLLKDDLVGHLKLTIPIVVNSLFRSSV